MAFLIRNIMNEIWVKCDLLLLPSVISPLAYIITLKLTGTSQNDLGSFAHACANLTTSKVFDISFFNCCIFFFLFLTLELFLILPVLQHFKVNYLIFTLNENNDIQGT